MTLYALHFDPRAKREWDNLDGSTKTGFKKKLAERLVEPHIPSARLRGMDNCYKIKLRSAGFRLVYQVRDNELIIIVVAIGKRERNVVYTVSEKRVNR